MKIQEGTISIPGHSDVPTPAQGHAAQSHELERRFRERGHAETHGDCKPVAEILSRIGDKWSVLVVMLLGNGPKRFNELKRLIGAISQRMLTLTLRGLERDGFVTRTVFPTVPPRVDYALTPLGESLRGPISALGAWAFDNRSHVEAARQQFDDRPTV